MQYTCWTEQNVRRLFFRNHDVQQEHSLNNPVKTNSRNVFTMPGRVYSVWLNEGAQLTLALIFPGKFSTAANPKRPTDSMDNFELKERWRRKRKPSQLFWCWKSMKTAKFAGRNLVLPDLLQLRIADFGGLWVVGNRWCWMLYKEN